MLREIKQHSSIPPTQEPNINHYPPDPSNWLTTHIQPPPAQRHAASSTSIWKQSGNCLLFQIPQCYIHHDLKGIGMPNHITKSSTEELILSISSQWLSPAIGCAILGLILPAKQTGRLRDFILVGVIACRCSEVHSITAAREPVTSKGWSKCYDRCNFTQKMTKWTEFILHFPGLIGTTLRNLPHHNPYYFEYIGKIKYICILNKTLSRKEKKEGICQESRHLEKMC